MRLSRLAVFLVGVAGCGGSDPCDGKSGVCVSLRVEGTAGGLDQLFVTVDKPTPKSLRTPMPAAAFSLPVQVALVFPGGTAGPITVAVDGLSKDKVVAHESASIAIAAGRGRGKVTLKSGTAACTTVCSAPMRCEPSSSRCVRCLVDGDCASGEYCDSSAFDCKPGCRGASDCLGSGGECCQSRCVDPTTDAQNCGGCGTMCALVNATAKCDSSCKVDTCTAGFANCNFDHSDGCEQNIDTDVMHCGGCTTVCSGMNASSISCGAGVCANMCNAGFGDCDMDPVNGCEHAVDTLAECGACARPCAPANATGASCSSSGACDYTSCMAGFLDLDGNRANGCEVNTATDPRNCGGLNRVCSMTNVDVARCENGRCASTCTGTFGNCVLPAFPTADDGCESNTNTHFDHCGRCNRACSSTNVTSRMCTNGMCSSICSNGFGNCVQPSTPPSPAPAVADDGCETNTNTSNTNCGACTSQGGQVCISPLTCAGGVCGCNPSGSRAPFDTLSEDTAGGCWNSNPCREAWTWDGTGQNFNGLGQAITCSGAATCISHVSIGTYNGSTNCQGRFEVFCDGSSVGFINTVGSACSANATSASAACRIDFSARTCTAIRLVSVTDTDTSSCCCCNGEPDSMVVMLSAW